MPAAMAACAAVLGLRRSGDTEDAEVDSPLPISESLVFLDGVLGELRSGEVGDEVGGDCDRLGLFWAGTRRSRSGS